MALENRLKEHRARLGIIQTDHQSDRERGLLAVGDAGFEAGEDLSGNSGRYFYLYGGRRR